MFKKLLFITILLLLPLNGQAFAHTGLKSSSPQNGETISGEILQITLNFETKIEQTSTFQVKNAQGTEVNVQDITINNDQMIGNLETTLDNGDYQVRWQIIGADGHPIEGDFSFIVNKPITENQHKEETNIPSQSENNSNTDQIDGISNDETLDQSETTKESSDQTEGEASTSQQSQLPTYLVPVIIGILVLIIAVSFIVMKRKNKK